MVLLIIDAQAPYHSAFLALGGGGGAVDGAQAVDCRQAFGKFDHRRLEADGVGREARLVEVCNSAVREYVGLLRTPCRVWWQPMDCRAPEEGRLRTA